ncbi:hypothetical protein PG987_006676 [Apiospora arundinis]
MANQHSRDGSLYSSTISLEPLDESIRIYDHSASRLISSSGLHTDLESINDGPRQRLFPPVIAQAPGRYRCQKPHILHRMNYYGAALLTLGTVILLGVCGFLLFFWTQASRAGNNEVTGALWKRIVDAEWTTLVVTVSTSVIRLVISAQAGFAMAMVAALILESSGSNYHSLPALSVFRATSPQPWSLLRFLRFTHVASSVYSVLVLLTFVLANISQFTSTILISDFSRTNITRSYESVMVPHKVVWDELVLGDRGAWKTLSAQDGLHILSISVCFTQTPHVGVNVTMRGLSSRDEPTISWLPSLSGPTGIGNMSTLAVREHYGVTNKLLSLPERGIMSLDLEISEKKSTEIFDVFRDWSELFIMGYNGYGPGYNTSSPHDTTIAIFHHIIDQTDNPAYAIQTLFTMLFQMKYYDRSYAFAASGRANYDLGESVSIPVRWTGLYGTLAIVILHLAVVFLIAGLFSARTEVTLLDSYWQAVAQIVSVDTAPLLQQADDMRDDDVKNLLEDPLKMKNCATLQGRRNDPCSIPRSSVLTAPALSIS